MMFREHSVGFKQLRAWIDPQMPVHIPCFHPSLTRTFKAECSVSIMSSPYSCLTMQEGKSDGGSVTKD